MSWWPFGSSGAADEIQPTSQFDAAIPPPPSGPFVAPPEKPKSLKNFGVIQGDFKGFSPPPVSNSSSSKVEEVSKNLFNRLQSPKDDDYATKDFSKFSESSGLDDNKYYKDYTQNSPSLADKYLTNPRARNCFESVKTGMKMGSCVGAIFGGLTGVYAGFIHRSLLLVPLSIVGGGVSFGFFLGCGMLVRCEAPPNMKIKNHDS